MIEPTYQEYKSENLKVIHKEKVDIKVLAGKF